TVTSGPPRPARPARPAHRMIPGCRTRDFCATPGSWRVERVGRRCDARTAAPAQGRAEEDTMSRLGRLFRATTAAALTAVGAPSAVAQQSAAPLPDISDFLIQNQVQSAGFGRSAPGCAPAPCNPCYPANPCGP